YNRSDEETKEELLFTEKGVKKGDAGMVRASRCPRLNKKAYIIHDSEVSSLSVVIHKYAHLAPNHVTEHARKIDDIFGDDVPNMSHM
ncbi:hypothetical protein, partial [Salmonella enterica]|uniref:hypothetical protein n=1 Tax=Salmonella enterica TaxID=28901 RepID=UPI00398C3F74